MRLWPDKKKKKNFLLTSFDNTKQRVCSEARRTLERNISPSVSEIAIFLALIKKDLGCHLKCFHFVRLGFERVRGCACWGLWEGKVWIGNTQRFTLDSLFCFFISPAACRKRLWLANSIHHCLLAMFRDFSTKIEGGWEGGEGICG